MFEDRRPHHPAQSLPPEHRNPVERTEFHNHIYDAAFAAGVAQQLVQELS